ncbi:MAG: hypothetical protein KAY24_18125 [Candidatus Eisenbacteria sp.]|nr:hypothetical protein [Candidatus Eisenbacteria bacterium]
MRTALNQGFLLDLGGGDLEDPPSFIKKHFLSRLDDYPSKGKEEDRKKRHKIAQAVLSHPHHDHIASCGCLREDDFYPVLLTCPHDKEPPDRETDERLNWTRFEASKAHDAYRALYKPRKLPLQTIEFDSSRTVPNLEYGVYYVRPPICDNLHPKDDTKYGNSTSIALYFRQGKHSILFPGDLTPEAMSRILDEKDGAEKRFTRFVRNHNGGSEDWHRRTGNQPSLESLLQEHGLTILVAPHHGLESCFSDELYAAIGGGKPRLVVLSERRKKHDGDGSTHAKYQCSDGASGLRIWIEGKEEKRFSVSTKNGHHILAVFDGSGRPAVYASKKPEELLEIAAP